MPFIKISNFSVSSNKVETGMFHGMDLKEYYLKEKDNRQFQIISVVANGGFKFEYLSLYIRNFITTII